jgi:CheY-like chemotaxis protein
VQHASESALALTRQLLSFSRRHAPPEVTIDLNDALRRSEAVKQAGVDVTHHPDGLPVFASQTEIDLIVRELASRVSSMARRRTAVAQLILSTTSVDLMDGQSDRHPDIQPGIYAVVSITTTEGSTNAKPDDSNVMQPGEAAAMGLSVMHATVNHCGGFVVRHGDSGFSAFLPCVPSMAAAAAADSPGQTILLVEDEPLVRELSRDMLERQGYRVLLAANANEAIQIGASAGAFDLLITDVSMPSITGVELARRLKSQHPRLKVLLISGYTEEDGVDSDDLGFDRSAVLQKPFSADSLGRKIRQLLSRA